MRIVAAIAVANRRVVFEMYRFGTANHRLSGLSDRATPARTDFRLADETFRHRNLITGS